MTDSASVVTLDGPSGVGKGTISRILSLRLGWRVLDSGAMYRLLAVVVDSHGIAPENTPKICDLAATLAKDIEFRLVPGEEIPRIFYQNRDVSDTLRMEHIGGMASVIAVQESVREALLEAQRAFRKPPGLIADGRDMGTVVFPQADLKIFLTASAEERATRRHKQLKEKGKDVSIQDLLRDITERDKRDASRQAAPMQAAPDAITLDTTDMTVDEVVSFIVERIQLGRQGT